MSAPALRNPAGQNKQPARRTSGHAGIAHWIAHWVVRRIGLVKVCVFIGSLIPLGLLIFHGLKNDLGPDPIATVTHATGFAALRFLIVSLAITPVRRLSPHLVWMIRFRRMLGLFAFFYACLHLITYVWLFSGFSIPAMANDISHRPYIISGMLAWTLLIPLAFTSTKKSIGRLGKRWHRLHQLAYFAAVCGVMHYWWIVKGGVRTPMTMTFILIVLFLARALWPYFESRRRAAHMA